MGALHEQIRQFARRFGVSDEGALQAVVTSALQLAAQDRIEAREVGGSTDEFEPFTLQPSEVRLFDYQREIADQAGECVRPGEAALLSLPTGAGKTRTAIAIALELIQREPASTVFWTAPSIELVNQALHTLRAVWQTTPQFRRVRVLGLTDPKVDGSQIRVGTIQLAAARLDDIRWSHGDLMVFDEAHQASARTYRRVVRTALAHKVCVLGLSATPGRATEQETQELVELFGGRLLMPPTLGRNPVAALRARGVLSNVEVLVARDHESDKVALWHCLRDCVQCGRRPGLIFSSSIAECYLAAAAMTLLGERVTVVSHNQPRAIRTERIDSLRRGKLDWIANVSILATGVDLPELRTVVLGAKIGSPILFEQVIGRVCRGPAVGGSETTFVVDPYRQFEHFGGISSYARYASTAW
jgi:DNA repair protein RadD